MSTESHRIDSKSHNGSSLRKPSLEAKLKSAPPTISFNPEPWFSRDGTMEWQGILTDFSREQVAGNMKEWYGQMERDCEDVSMERPQLLAALFVPNGGHGQGGIGTVYLSSGTQNQVDDLDKRRPSKGVNKNLHPLLAESLKSAAVMAVEENKGYFLAEKDEVGRPIVFGHSTCFACAEIVLLNWFLNERIPKDLDYEGYKPWLIFEEMPRLYVVGRPFARKGSEDNPTFTAMPCDSGVDVAKSRNKTGKDSGEQYPNISTAGCKHFVKLFGIHNDALQE